MNRIKIPIVLLVIVATGSVASLTHSVASQQLPETVTVWSVCPSGPPTCQYSKIQEAVAVARPEDWIQIRAGIYNETLTINKSLRLTGTSKDLVRLNGVEAGRPTVTLQVNEELKLLLDGLTILGAPPLSEEQPCYQSNFAPNLSLICPRGLEIGGQGKLVLTLNDVEITESYAEGLKCSDSSFEGSDVRLTILNSRVSNNKGTGIDLECGKNASVLLRNSIVSGNMGRGIFIDKSDSEVDVKQSTFSGNLRAGLSWRGTNGNLRVTESQFIDNLVSGVEIEANDQSSVSLDKLTVLDNGDGIVLIGDSEAIISIKDSIVEANDDAKVNTDIDIVLGSGLLVVTSGPTRIEGNSIAQNKHGIILIKAKSAQIDNNRITENKGWGVTWLEQPCFDESVETEGVVEGSDNEISGNGKGNLCPEDYSWPPDFIKKE